MSPKSKLLSQLGPFLQPGEEVRAITVVQVKRSAAKNVAKSAVATTAATVATLLVSPEEARKLELAKNQGKISLTLRNPLDHNALADNRPTTGESLYVGATRPKESALRTARVEPAVARQEPPKKQEPPKPRNVIDVFRGDKHVQEIFQ